MHSAFSFNDTSSTEIYTLSLHDALPISSEKGEFARGLRVPVELLKLNAATPVWYGAYRYLPEESIARLPLPAPPMAKGDPLTDRKSTRLNSSHVEISYAVFCLKKKKQKK